MRVRHEFQRVAAGIKPSGRWTSLALAVLLLGVLAGCAGTEAADSGPPASKSETSTDMVALPETSPAGEAARAVEARSGTSPAVRAAGERASAGGSVLAVAVGPAAAISGAPAT